MTTDDDRSLLRRIAAGDRGAFEALYHLYYRRLFGYLFKVTRRPELVEEVLNDVMLIVWQKAGRFDGRSKVSTWILGIAYRRALKALSKLPTREREELPDPDGRVEPEGPESVMARRELASRLGQALGHLPPEQRTVVELTYYQGCSYPEIAEVIGCPVNTVKTRMFHARRKLREILPNLGISAHGAG